VGSSDKLSHLHAVDLDACGWGCHYAINPSPRSHNSEFQLALTWQRTSSISTKHVHRTFLYLLDRGHQQSKRD